MFSLRNSSSDSSSGSDEDSFGWWIGVGIEKKAAESPSNSSGTSEDIGRNGVSSRELTSDVQQPLNNEKAVDVEVRLLDVEVEEKSEDEERRGLCYTPERLIRTEDYRILAPSPRLCPGLSMTEVISLSFKSRSRGWTTKTIDDRMIGAEHLATHLRGSNCTPSSMTTSCRRCCCIWYGNGEVMLHTERCPRSDEETERLNDPVEIHLSPTSKRDSYCDDNKVRGSWKSEDYQNKVTEDSSRLLPTTDDIRLTLDHESNTDMPHETTHIVCENQIEKNQNMNQMVSILPNTDEDPTDSKKLLPDDEKFKDVGRQPTSESVPKLILTIEADDKLTPLRRSADSKIELEMLRGKLEKIQDSNKDLYEEITLLWRDFMRDEWKVNHLSEDVKKLRNEVYELRYMDDLLKLLNGELERISNRNWPFAIGHTHHENEEINLVV